ncbi:MAG: sugar ABC transporter permease [Lachnospiraceae bacterium]|nr:sugar ABC transporter permease [Lachnospiraceae bacterium]
MAKRRRRFFYLFVLPGFIGIMIFVLIPFGDVVKRSFTTAVTGQFNGLKNYQSIFQNQAFLLAVGNTFKFTMAGIPLLVLSGFVAALLLNILKNKGWFKSLYLFPLAMPTATIVLVWKMVFYRNGFLNLLLTRVGMRTDVWGAVHKDYLGSGAAFWVLVGSYVWKNMGYTVILWLAGLSGIPAQLLEAAKVDGAGKWHRLWYVILPGLKGSLYTIVVLSFLNSFKIYREAYLTAGAYPDKSIYLLQHLFNNWFVNLELDKMAAAAVCTGGFLMIAIVLLQKLWDRNEA